MEISYNTKPALTLMSCNFGFEIAKELNDYLEESVFDKNIDASGSLVGQIKNHENSAQLIFPHDDDDVGQQFSEYLCRLANQYMGYTESDVVSVRVLQDETYITYPFEPIGSDERQYSSPAFKIPTATITKSKYYEYDQYHTSLDNLDFISSLNLKKTLDIYLKAIYYLEHNQKYKRKFNECEFMLSKIDNIYPSTGGTISQTLMVKNHLNHEYTSKSNGKILDCISWLSFGCDGDTTLFEIQEMSQNVCTLYR